MSTTLKEWLLKTIAELEEERDAVPGAVNEEADNALAAMKLAMASLEAEPVAWLWTHSERENDVSLTTPHNDEDAEDAMACGWSVQPLYTAMLQGAEHVSNCDELPDGWVACSERIPEGMTDVHISNGHDVGQGWWDGDTWQTQHDYYSVPGEVTHWQPLPSPPVK
ncbi:TPA: DUF551 domain-containing protein [Enterobacter hormaechei subsp. steigerwaltii]|nr:DUF551 domain-containing protein [Enterobacter hormaechei subsp. steigerwaltii]